MVGIASMLVSLVIPVPCKVATDQNWMNAPSVSQERAYPYENKSSLQARDRRDTFGRKPPILLSNDQQNTAYNLSHLADMCPYADICDRQGREIQSLSRASCCLPCSCDTTCKKIGNCCDKREATGYMCHSPFLKHSEINQTARDGYFMVDRCLDGSEIDCKAEKAAAWGAFYPVYDPVLKLNFYNPRCAECSGANDYANWGINVACQGLRVNDGYFLNVLRGKMTKDCIIEFTPPKKMIGMNHLCSTYLISRCNVTGWWKIYNSDLEEACSRWYSPVVSKWRGYLKYANTYCQQCNEYTATDPEDLCTPAKMERSTFGNSLMLTIDYTRVASLIDKRSAEIDKPNSNGVCGQGTVEHISIEQVSCMLLLLFFFFSQNGHSRAL